MLTKRGAVGFWAAQIVMNAIWGAAFWAWLQIPDQKLWQIGVTMLTGIVLVVPFLILQGATFAFFGSALTARESWLRGLRKLPLFGAWAFCFFLLVGLVARWRFAWLGVAVLLLPLASWAVNGFMPRVYTKWWYWVSALALLLVGVYGPLHLFLWVPALGGFALQAVSLAVRAGLGYLLVVVAWMMLVYVSVGGRPFATQASTLARP